MPRRERSVQGKSLVAAAKNYTTGRSADKQDATRARQAEDWQHAAWDFYDTVPEYHQGCAIMGALLSRARLIVEEKGADGTWAPTKNPTALAALEAFFGGEDGQRELLRQLGVHMSVAGEAWLFGVTKGGEDEWLVAAATEVRKTAGGQWSVGGDELPGRPTVIRVWKRHPRKPNKSDCPTRAVLPVLAELHQLTKRVAAQIDSRLTGAGILFVPSETSFPALPTRTLNQGDPAQVSDGVQQNDAQGLADLLVDVAEIAIQNPERAEAMIPIIAQTPGEYIQNVKHINFWSELDKAAPALRAEGIRRLALGMDVPPEVLLGNSGSNHWNAWLSDENSVKIHGEPLLMLLAGDLTAHYLHKALDEEPDIDDPTRFRIGADTSQMRMRPNRSKEALELNDRLIMSDEAALRENGFTEADMMDSEGVMRALVRKVAGGSTTPELVEAALRRAGVDLDIQITDTREPAEARPTPSLREHPSRELPERAERPAAQSAGLVFAAEQIVDRALQRAGNRIKSKMGLKGSTVPANRVYMGVSLSPSDIDDALQDAWAACMEFDYGVSGEELARALDLYTRSIMQAGRPPSRAGVAVALKLMSTRTAP